MLIEMDKRISTNAVGKVKYSIKHSRRGFWSWQLIAFIALLVYFVLLGKIVDSLPHMLQALGGQHATSHLVAKHIESRSKHGTAHIIEVSYYDREGTLQIADIDIEPDLYNKLVERAPIDIVYSPKHPDLAYVTEGQGEPMFIFVTTYIAMILILPAVILRYKAVLTKKVF